MTAVQQIRQQIEATKANLERGHGLRQQVRHLASENLLELIAARLNMLVNEPCSTCDPAMCQGGPAMCALALVERMGRDVELEEEVKKLRAEVQRREKEEASTPTDEAKVLAVAELTRKAEHALGLDFPYIGPALKKATAEYRAVVYGEVMATEGEDSSQIHEDDE